MCGMQAKHTGWESLGVEAVVGSSKIDYPYLEVLQRIEVIRAFVSSGFMAGKFNRSS